MRRALPLCALLLATALPAIAEGKPVPERPKVAADARLEVGLVRGGDVGCIFGDADQYGSGIVDFKSGIRWSGSHFAPKISLALRKTLLEEEGAGEKIDTFGVNFGFELGQ